MLFYNCKSTASIAEIENLKRVVNETNFEITANSATEIVLDITSPAEEERIAMEKARLEAEALAQQPQKPQQEIKDKPSSTIGDDFEASW